MILGGNFNCPLNTLLDNKGGIMILRKSVVASIDCIQSELDLVHIWRVKNPSTKSYTWSQKLLNIFCRLDYWLISTNLHDLVKSIDIIPSIKTDHTAITLDLQNSDNEIKGPGFWNVNCALLEDDDYINDVTYYGINRGRTFSESNDFHRLSKGFQQFGVELSFKLPAIF